MLFYSWAFVCGGRGRTFVSLEVVCLKMFPSDSNKEKFQELYIEARQVCSVENAKAGFRATGIHPFDPLKVPFRRPPTNEKL
jgi:hypothetical protein